MYEFILFKNIENATCNNYYILYIFIHAIVGTNVLKLSLLV